MIKSSSNSLQDKANAELIKLDKELDAKLDESAKVIEKSKSQSAEQIKEQMENEAKKQKEQIETKSDMNFLYCEFLPPPTSYPALAGFMDRSW